MSQTNLKERPFAGGVITYAVNGEQKVAVATGLVNAFGLVPVKTGKVAILGLGGAARASGRSRWDKGLTIAEMKRSIWVKPEVVCQIKFSGWTQDDRLRQPVYWGYGKTKIPTMLLKKMRQKQLIDKAIRLSSDEEQQAYDCLEKEKPGAGECQSFGLTLFAE